MNFENLEKNCKKIAVLNIQRDRKIEELFARDLQLRKIIRFWITKYPLKEIIIMDLLDDKERICYFELPRDEK